MGRPSKRTPAIEKLIVDAIEKGASDFAAAEAAGIHRDTLREWLRDPEFSGTVASARARAVIDAEKRVMSGNALAYLTQGPGRRYLASIQGDGEDERWIPASRVELTGADGGPVRVGPAVDLSRLSLTEQRQLLELTLKAEQGDVS